MTLRTALDRNTAHEVPLDTHPEVSLDFRHVREALKAGYARPFLLIDPEIIRTKYRRFHAAMPRVRAHYAVKANPDPRVVGVLAEEGAGFEIASTAELDLLLSLGVPAAEVHYSNPVKARQYIEYAARKGVQWFSLDSAEELVKIHSVAPQAKLYLRIDTPNVGSDWPLSGKFGAQGPEIDQILDAAAQRGADLCGVTFHVGSQCRNAQNWHVAIDNAKRIFRKMRLKGLTPSLLNIGGGFPVRLTKPIPSIETIAEVVNRAVADLPGDIRLMAEPGRYLVSDSAYFVCRVIGTAWRAGRRWLYLDTGMFGGLLESTQGLQYDLRTDRNGKRVPWHVAGPTCDSVDVLMQDQMLPEDLQDGDFIYIPNAGAYTTAYASQFNGFPLPDVRLV
ncbi:MAG TPA: type III PLP-dependent enzyme [Burkholderiales bacterium]|jgi:ornithine decarboxylase|nr:type III PLP-dependent enzyme [Burkholderiales bacterium]